MSREWKTGTPAEVGWYVVTGDPGGRDAGEWRSYWNGQCWVAWAHAETMRLGETVVMECVPTDTPIYYAEKHL